MRTPAPRVLGAATSALALALLAACGGGEDPTTTRSPERAKPCQGGEVRFLQGQPADLPGGGTAGIGQVFEDRRPVEFNLAVGTGSYDERATEPLAVGDEFAVEGTSYRVTCISPGVVTLDQR